MEEPALGLDPMTLASMINNDEDIAAQSIKVSVISTIQPEHLLSEVFYGDKSQLVLPRDLGFVSLTSYFQLVFLL